MSDLETLALASSAVFFVGVAVRSAFRLVRLIRDYRADRKAAVPPLPAPEPAMDGAALSYAHDLGWPVRIIQGVPVALGPNGSADVWSAVRQAWIWLDPEDVRAREGHERLKLEGPKFVGYTTGNSTYTLGEFRDHSSRIVLDPRSGTNGLLWHDLSNWSVTAYNQALSAAHQPGHLA